MDDPLAVGLVQRIRDLNGRLERLLQRQGPLGQPLGQRLALQVLHHQEVHAVLAPHVVERADVRVVQAGDGLGFALEPLLQLRVASDVRGQDFDGDRAVEAGVAGFVHLAHAASPEGGDDLIRTKPNAGGERHDPPGERNGGPGEV